MTPVLVTHVELGDELANVGVVTGIERVGVFIILTVRGTIWCLGTGKGDIASWDVVRHQSEVITVGVRGHVRT